jgi:hypothetical protein
MPLSMLAENIRRIEQAASGGFREIADASLQAAAHRMARSQITEQQLETQWRSLLSQRLRLQRPVIPVTHNGDRSRGQPAAIESYSGFGLARLPPRVRGARSRSRGGLPPAPRPPARTCVARSDFLQTGMQFVGTQFVGMPGPLRAWKVVIELSNVRFCARVLLQCYDGL